MAVDRRAVAYHEAGHFVAALRLGLDSYGIDIVGGGDIAGSVSGDHWFAHFDGDDAEVLKKYLVTLFCGFSAQVKYDPSQIELARSNAGSDDEYASELLRELGLGDSEQHVYREQADSLIQEDWKLVSHLAEELLQYGTIPADEAELIVEVADGEPGAELALANLRALSRRG